VTASGIGRAGDSLGSSFFSGEAKALRETLDKQEEAAREMFAEATGIDDDDLLGRVAGLGIRVETLAAFTLSPLLEVAWADGVMDEKERSAILRGAVSTGIREGSLSHRLLEIWTDERPPPDLFPLWEEFARALSRKLDSGDRDAFRDALAARAKAVAQAAGGFLSLGSNISRAEAEALAKIKSAFDREG
jgi:hypothetical protein